ncbi:MAG TPA: hypothetical protein PKI03_12810 [Pseudomonadota bacterium]|nr:hypothetical protein [Pseudomonadota bacterium]
MLLRDTDGHQARCRGLQQARQDRDRTWPFPVIIGAAHPRREQLDANDEQAKRSAKRVLRILIGSDRDREERCLTEAPLPMLATRGQACGLANFLRYIDKRLLPLV